jgi:hypothetical protein
LPSTLAWGLGMRAPLVSMAGFAAEAVFEPTAMDRLASR